MSEEQTKPVEEQAANAAAEDSKNQQDDPGSQPQAATDEVQARVDELEAALNQAEQRAKGYFDGWQRERADFANFKKRIEREMSDIRQSATHTTLLALLPVVDDFERAIGNVPDEMREHSWLEGITAIQRKMERILSDQGLEAIDPVGQDFDPNLHEAIGVDADSDAESGQVTETLQKGYRSGDRVLRPALVRVAG